MRGLKSGGLSPSIKLNSELVDAVGGRELIYVDRVRER